MLAVIGRCHSRLAACCFTCAPFADLTIFNCRDDSEQIKLNSRLWNICSQSHKRHHRRNILIFLPCTTRSVFWCQMWTAVPLDWDLNIIWIHNVRGPSETFICITRLRHNLLKGALECKHYTFTAPRRGSVKKKKPHAEWNPWTWVTVQPCIDNQLADLTDIFELIRPNITAALPVPTLARLTNLQTLQWDYWVNLPRRRQVYSATSVKMSASIVCDVAVWGAEGGKWCV